MKVLAFPRARDLNFVRRQAARMANLNEDAAKQYLLRQLHVQRETMQRRGVAAYSIDKNLDELEIAIRNELWHELISPGGAA
jgi:hypothetical protein